MKNVKIKKRPFFLCSIFSIFLLAGCSSEPPYKRETELFSSYLKRNFDLSIPAEKRLYCISQKYECKGCTDYTIHIMSKFTDKTATVITTRNRLIVSDNLTLLYDNDGEIDRLNLKAMGTVLIFTELGHIKKIHPVNANALEKVDSLLQHFYMDDSNVPVEHR